MSTKVGTVSGALVGAVKGAVLNLSMTMITWDACFDTAFFAFMGATVGYFTTQLWKYVKSKFS